MKKRLALGLAALLAGGLLWAGWRASGGDSPEALVQGLDGPDGVNCFSQLRQSEETSVVQAIVEGTHHPSPKVRLQCARLLGQRLDVNMAGYLKPMLADKDDGVRLQAARALVPLLDDQELMELLPQKDLPPATQLLIVQAMLCEPGAIDNEQFLNWCLDRSHSPELRSGIYLALRDYEASFSRGKELPAARGAARTRLSKQAKADAFDEKCPIPARAGALQLYAGLRGSEALEEIRPLTGSKDAAVSEAAILALASTKNDRAAALMCSISLDKARPVSSRAVALGCLRCFRWNLQALETARRALDEQDPRLRTQAARCLGVLGDKTASAESRYSLGPSLEGVRKALTQEQDPEALSALRTALSSLEARQRDR